MKERKLQFNPSPDEITFKGGRSYIRKIAEQLKANSRVFISNMDRREAYNYKKRFSAILGKSVVADPVRIRGEDGYLFELAADQ